MVQVVLSKGCSFISVFSVFSVFFFEFIILSYNSCSLCSFHEKSFYLRAGVCRSFIWSCNRCNAPLTVRATNRLHLYPLKWKEDCTLYFVFFYNVNPVKVVATCLRACCFCMNTPCHMLLQLFLFLFFFAAHPFGHRKKKKHFILHFCVDRIFSVLICSLVVERPFDDRTSLVTLIILPTVAFWFTCCCCFFFVSSSNRLCVVDDVGDDSFSNINL